MTDLIFDFAIYSIPLIMTILTVFRAVTNQTTFFSSLGPILVISSPGNSDMRRWAFRMTLFTILRRPGMALGAFFAARLS